MVKFIRFKDVKLVELTDEEYFGKEYSNYISNSRLGLINPSQGGSPSKYAANSHGSSNSYVYGTAVHQVILEGFEVLDVVMPTEKVKLIVEYLANHGYDFEDLDGYKEAIVAADYYKGKFNEGRHTSFLSDDNKRYYDYLLGESKGIVLPKSIKNDVLESINNIKQCKLINDLVRPEGAIHGFEVACLAIAEVEVDGVIVELPVKCKFDNYTHKNNELVLNDVKTSSGGYYKFGGYSEFEIYPDAHNELKVIGTSTFEHWHYYRQMAMYGELLKGCYPDSKLVQYNMLVVGTREDKTAGVYKVPEYYINLGLEEMKDLICKVAYCTINGFVDPVEEKVDDDLLSLFL